MFKKIKRKQREPQDTKTEVERKQRESPGKLIAVIKEMEVVRETPLGREKLMSQENIEIPLVQVAKVESGEEKFSLRDVRKFVNLNFKRELIEAEKRSKKTIVKKGILSKLLGFKGKTIVMRTGESKKFMLNHLRSTKPYPRAIGTVAIAFYLKEFLEVIFEIEEELTYDKMADVIETKNIDPKLKKELFEFFKTVSKQIYEGKVTLDYKKAYELAERTVEQLL